MVRSHVFYPGIYFTMQYKAKAAADSLIAFVHWYPVKETENQVNMPFGKLVNRFKIKWKPNSECSYSLPFLTELFCNLRSPYTLKICF